jgi:hypothetical protein
MGKSDLASKDLEAISEEDVTKIDFPEPIVEAELDDLMRYVVSEISRKNQCDASISSDRNKHYNIDREGRFETGDGDIKIRGEINVYSSPRSSSSFSVRSDYDGLDRNVFTGISFEVTPGYKPGELHSDDVGIMQETRRCVERFFELKKER